MNNRNERTIDALNFLIGSWRTSGETFGSDTKQIAGFDTYEWILDKQFILHSVDVKMDQEQVKAFEIIAATDDHRKYSLRSFDNHGEFTEMQGELNDNGQLMINGNRMRAKLVVISKERLIAHWERKDDNNHWLPWMEIVLVRK